GFATLEHRASGVRRPEDGTVSHARIARARRDVALAPTDRFSDGRGRPTSSRLARPTHNAEGRMTDLKNGDFTWYDLLTSNPKEAVEFYTHVVEWTSQPFDKGPYTLFLGSQGPLGGASDLPEPARKMGAPPHWTSNVQVADVDATCAEVKKLGGKVHVE